MSSTCCLKYYLLDLALKFQCSSSSYYTLQIEKIHVIFNWKNLSLTFLWKYVHIPLCSLHLLHSWKIRGTISLTNWCIVTTVSTTSPNIFATCAITTSSATYSNTSTTDINRYASVSFQSGIIWNRGILWCSSGIPWIEVEEVHGRNKPGIYSISPM